MNPDERGSREAERQGRQEEKGECEGCLGAVCWLSAAGTGLSGGMFCFDTGFTR